ncbi:MAG: WbuC family cupin fold metalloprotein [Candidatus Omnitrophica bacterium]|nr:WbuC family cupin fold metalloprotein [Candidatus Omnitrophota bacterium]
MITITDTQLNNLSDQAQASPRRRMNLNFHSSGNEPINRLMNAFEPGTYVRPHKHESPDKIEVFILLRGRALVVEFNNEGTITEYTVLDNTKGIHGVEIPPRVWHTLISLQTGTVLYEIKQGPYVKASDKDFASWSPREEHIDTSQKFISDIINNLSL